MSYQPENLERWKKPDSFIAWNDGAPYSSEWFVYLGQHRDSDTLTRSNFITGLEAIGGKSDSVLVARESHWAVGWVEWIAIHQSDAEALKKADEIMAALSDYPVIDECHWSELEWNEAADFWESMSPRDRAEYCREAGISIFAARRDCMPSDDSGHLLQMLNGY